MLDGSRSFALSGGGTLTPSLEVGVRHDGGDAETGTGMELGAGLGYADPSRGLVMAVRVHGLAAHAEDDYGERGVSGSLRFVPGDSGRGLTASFTPSYGADADGSQRLCLLPEASVPAVNEAAEASNRLDGELGHGMAVFGGGLTGTPNVRFGLSDSVREYRMGWWLTPAGGGAFELGLDSARRDDASEAPEHRVGFGVTARWCPTSRSVGGICSSALLPGTAARRAPSRPGSDSCCRTGTVVALARRSVRRAGFDRRSAFRIVARQARELLAMASVTRADLAQAVSEESGLTHREARALVDMLIEEIASRLEAGEGVKITGFGSFKLHDKAARTGRNPKTREAAAITPRRVVTFRASQALKRRIAGGMSGGENGS